MKPQKKKTPSYDLCDIKYLVLMGRYMGTIKSFNWLKHHGYVPEIAWKMILSLDESEFIESLPPLQEGGSWADVYRCEYFDNELQGVFYVKFLVRDDALILVLLSCKEWGYGW